MCGSRIRGVILGFADLFALVALSPDAFGLVARLPYMGHLLRTDPDQAIAACGVAALWCVALWVGLGLALTAIADGCSRRAEAARSITRLMFPAAARRLLAGALGVSIVVTPTAAFASTPTPPPPAPAAIHSNQRAPAPAWPLSPSTPQRGPGEAPPWPQSSTFRPHPAPGTAHATHRRAGSVTVRPGDCLWSIAQRQLGDEATPQRITTAWWAWFHTNRRVIGDDPSFITPGQVLHAPPLEETS